MHLTLIRNCLYEESTLGELYVGGEFLCYTLEDKVRPEKVQGETAIPEGTYEVVITRSRRFKKLLPLLLNVPGFDGVRIHSGNSAEDTRGCILVGATKEEEKIAESRTAYASLLRLLRVAVRKEPVTIEITEAGS
jgi:hypothetical protein